MGKKLVHLDYHGKSDHSSEQILFEMSEAPTPVLEEENKPHFRQKSEEYEKKKERSKI